MTTLVLIMKRAGNIRVMRDALIPAGFCIVAVSDPEALEAALVQTDPRTVALVDISGFGPAVWDICEKLHMKNIRFVVLSIPQSGAVGSRALGCGAASYLEKPVGKSALLRLLRSLAEP